MKRTSLFAAVAIALLAASQTGCGGESRPNNQEAISKAQLALMPLPKSELGPPAKGLRLSANSGVVTNAEAAADTTANDVSAAELRNLGRVVGYELYYKSAAGKRNESGREALSIDTAVEIFVDDAAARDGFGFWEEYESGLVPFTTMKLGDESYGYWDDEYSKKNPAHYVDVGFRDGRILASVFIWSDGRDQSVEALALSLAKKLEKRIERTLDGKIVDKPVPIPAKT